MTSKNFLFSALLLVLAGFVAAGADGYWWRTPMPAAASASDLPDPAAEYGRLRQRYQTVDSAMDVSGMIRIYDGEHNGKLKEIQPFRSVRSSRQYYWQIGYLRNWYDGSILLVVDTMHRRMTVSRPVSDNLQSTGPYKMPADLLFSDTARFRLSGTVEQEQGQRTLTLHSDYNPEIRVCRVYYDTATYRLHRTEIEWWKDLSGRDTAAGKVWLAKVEYTYCPPRIDICKEMRTFITVGANGVTPTLPYANFDIKVNF
jgi:hypothetical protein